ncbi:MAG: cupredoxin domain-containing protein [Microgenomates group bacterium]
MTPDKYIVLISGIGLIGFIWWFFFGKEEKETLAADNSIEITVSGGYKPSVLKIKKDVTTTLLVKRTEQNSCLEEIVFPDFKIKEYLPVNEVVKINIRPTKTGNFEFHCGMNMYKGKIIVV